MRIVSGSRYEQILCNRLDSDGYLLGCDPPLLGSSRHCLVGEGMTEPNWNAWFSRIRMGKWMDTQAIAWAPFHGNHWFIAGETGYGKSNDERIILSELSYGIEEGAVEVIGFDAQLGVELQEAERAGLLKEFYYGKGTGTPTKDYPDGLPYEATFADAFEKHVGIMRERSEWMRLRGVNEWTITCTDPGRVVMLDEAGQLFRPSVGTKLANRITGAIETLTMQSRKCGYVLVACTQLSNLKSIPFRHGLTFGICHRMKNPNNYDQVTGNGEWPEPLPRGVPGLAYMSGHGKRILRTQFIPKLARERDPIIVNSARMPAFVEENVHQQLSDNYEPYPSYEPIPLSGEVLDPVDEFESEYAHYKRNNPVR